MTTIFKLQTSLCGFKKGTLVYYDSEWKDWEINGKTYNHRGSIGEGELAMLLDAIRHMKLTTIMEEQP